MFRPCIDLHDGIVKQIVGGTLKSAGAGESEAPVTNFVAELPAEHYARWGVLLQARCNSLMILSGKPPRRLYQKDGLAGGHVIMLGKGNEPAALSALRAYPGGLQVGGITEEKA